MCFHSSRPCSSLPQTLVFSRCSNSSWTILHRPQTERRCSYYNIYIFFFYLLLISQIDITMPSLVQNSLFCPGCSESGGDCTRGCRSRANIQEWWCEAPPETAGISARGHGPLGTQNSGWTVHRASVQGEVIYEIKLATLHYFIQIYSYPRWIADRYRICL